MDEAYSDWDRDRDVSIDDSYSTISHRYEETEPSTKNMDEHLQRLVEGNYMKTAALVESSLSDTTNCHICLEEYEDDDEIAQTPCKHLFHKNCIFSWFKRFFTTCPSCRYDLLSA